MTSARVQPFCRKHNINIGCYDGFRVCRRNITERNTATKMHNNHFCLIWETDCVSFNKAIEDELEPNFKVVDIVISDKHVKSFNKYEYKSKKVQSQSTNMVVYDIETFNTDRAVPLIGATSTSITVSVTGIGLIVLPLSAGIACTLSLGNKVLDKVIIIKYNKYKKQYEKDQNIIKSFDKLYSES